MRKYIIILLTLSLFIPFISGCGGSSTSSINPAPIVPTPTEPVSPDLSLTGYVYKPVDVITGNDFAGISKNGLIVTDNPLEDGSYEPVNGASVKNQQSTNITQTDSNGKFQMTNISEGELDLIVDPSTSTNGSDYSPVSEKILIVNPNNTTEIFPPDELKVVPVKITVPNGKKHQFRTNFKQGNKNVVSPSGVIWSVEGGIGTVDSYGLFTATTPGTGKVIATWGELTSFSTVRVIKDNSETGNLHGFVKLGADPLEGAIIIVEGISQIGITDFNGEFLISEIAFGTYNVFLYQNDILLDQKQVEIIAGQTL